MKYTPKSEDSAVKRLAVIGGGPAGMMAAGTALLYGAEVTIFEHMPYLGKKLGITGKGRCNVTNNCSNEEFMQNVTKNPRFLYSALSNFSTEDTINFFEGLGVTLKVERGNRVFPASDRAADIVKAMRSYCDGCKIIHEKVRDIKSSNGTFTVKTTKEYLFDKVILATGGRSYPLTGSDGSGYKLARGLGHTVTPLSPSLIPINSSSSICSELQGLSLKNVSIRITTPDEKTIYSDFGEMMFTHFGVTGPMILSASSHIKGYDIKALKLHIDLKPALDSKTLDERLISDFKKNSNRDFINSLSELLPSKLIEPFVRNTGIDPRKKVNLITRSEREKILEELKDLKIPLTSYRPIEEAIITSGGIEVKEINPKTMESRICGGLYFAGEIIDLDAYTGGFNLQIAFSTGYTAGMNASI